MLEIRKDRMIFIANVWLEGKGSNKKVIFFSGPATKRGGQEKNFPPNMWPLSSRGGGTKKLNLFTASLS